MVATVSRLTSQMTPTLRSRMVLFTTLILIVACSSLSWYFVSRQIDSATEALLMSGKELAAQLAGATQHSVVVKDSRRIQELIRSTVALDNVDYVFVASGDNTVLGAMGTQEFKQLAGDRMALDWLPLLTSRRAQALSARSQLAPLSVHVVDGRPVTEPGFISTTEQWIAVFLGSDRPHFFDLVVPIRRAEPTDPDPALGLTLDEMGTGAENPQDFSASLYGVVQVGLTDRHHQQLLRSLVGQGILIALAILATGIVIVVYFAKRMTLPLNDLTAVARQVGAGDLSATATVQSSDEIGELTQVFNQMTFSLRSREQELVELNRTLEAKVENRTHEVKEANERLQELDRLKTALVSNASHELRTPLTSIKVHVMNLLDGVSGSLGEDQRDSLGRIQGNVERLRTLIDDLLDLSLLHTGRAEVRHDPVGLNQLIHEVVDSLRYFLELKEMSITITLSSDLQDIPADREKLRRIFTNVIHNAIKFTAPGGRILIEALQDANDSVTISVQDSGSGIAPEELEKIFLPFFRSSNNASQIRGSGLGLSIAQELVQLHHGALWVESTVGKGSYFFIKLPTATGNTTASVPAIQQLGI